MGSEMCIRDSVVVQAETKNASDVIPASLLVPGCMFDATSNEVTPPKHPGLREAVATFVLSVTGLCPLLSLLAYTDPSSKHYEPLGRGC